MREFRGPAIAIAALITLFTTVLAALIVVVGWTSFSVYALVKLIGGGSDEPNATGIVVAMVLIVTTFVALLAGTIKLVGKAMEPAKRGEPEPLEVPGL
jgi:Kef-type K+ transport system membrane component KefB